jgi:hypothetical protein
MDRGRTKMMHIIIGLFFISLGIWGVFDEWYYVVDFVKGSGAVLLVLAGLVGILAGLVGPIHRAEESDDEDLSESSLGIEQS